MRATSKTLKERGSPRATRKRIDALDRRTTTLDVLDYKEAPLKLRAPRRRATPAPTGFRWLPGDWLTPIEDAIDDDAERQVVDALTLVRWAHSPDVPARVKRAPNWRASVVGLGRNLSAAYAQLIGALARASAETGDGMKSWWAVWLRVELAAAACAPIHRRPTARAVAAEVTAAMRRPAGQVQATVPDSLEAAIRSVLSDDLRKLAPGRGGGPRKKLGAASAVKKIVAVVRAQSQVERYRQKIFRMIGDSPGLSAEGIRQQEGGDPRSWRRALATLEREKKIENRGTAKNPRYFATF